MNTQMSIGDRIRALAVAMSLDIKDFAARVGVPYRTLQNYIYGKREPGADVIAQICTHTGACGHWLLTGEGGMLREDVPETSLAGDVPAPLAPQEQRIRALLGVLADLDDESRAAVLSDCFTRAETAKQIAELRQAVQELEAKQPTKQARQAG